MSPSVDAVASRCRYTHPPPPRPSACITVIFRVVGLHDTVELQLRPPHVFTMCVLRGGRGYDGAIAEREGHFFGGGVKRLLWQV